MNKYRIIDPAPQEEAAAEVEVRLRCKTDGILVLEWLRKEEWYTLLWIDTDGALHRNYMPIVVPFKCNSGRYISTWDERREE